MTYDFASDDDFHAIENSLSRHSNKLLEDAWVYYKGEKWFPKIIEDQETKLCGFEVNLTGQRGSKSRSDRPKPKFTFQEFLTKLLDGSFPTQATVRCKRPEKTGTNARHLNELEYSAQFTRLIGKAENARSTHSESEIEKVKDLNRPKSVDMPSMPESDDSTTSGLPTLNHGRGASAISASEQEELGIDTQQLTTDEREAVVKIRYGQGAFREALLRLDGDKCWMSGIEGKQLLVASHIKPWSKCQSDTDARGQPGNGLLLSALWDSVFDSGLICFDADFQVIASSKLSESAKDALGLARHRALHEKFRSEERRAYLKYHRDEVFKN